MRHALSALLLTGFLLAVPASAQEVVPAEAAPVLPEADPEAPGHRWTVTGEYLLWWLREGRVPAVLTTSSFASEGLLGQPDTRIVYGDDRLETRHDDRFIGTRLGLEYWFDAEQTWGVEGRAVFLERDSTWFRATSDGSVLLARPYVSALDGSAQSKIIAGLSPQGLLSGGFNGYSRIELFTQELNLVRSLFETPTFRVDLLAGARFMQMRDRTDLTTASKLLPQEAIIFGCADHLRAHDMFWGGQLGLRGKVNRGRWFANSRVELGLGGNEQTLRTFADSVFATPFQRIETAQGFSVLPSNTGTVRRTALNGVYELNANVGCRLLQYSRLFVGYTLFLWDSPIRAGDQVDLVLNPTQFTSPLVGPARPAVPFKEDFFWAQGLNFGLEFRW